MINDLKLSLDAANVSIYTCYALQLDALIVALTPESVRISNITSHSTSQLSFPMRAPPLLSSCTIRTTSRDKDPRAAST